MPRPVMQLGLSHDLMEIAFNCFLSYFTKGIFSTKFPKIILPLPLILWFVMFSRDGSYLLSLLCSCGPISTGYKVFDLLNRGWKRGSYLNSGNF